MKKLLLISALALCGCTSMSAVNDESSPLRLEAEQAMDRIFNYCLSLGYKQGSPELEACYFKNSDEWIETRLAAMRGRNVSSYYPPWYQQRQPSTVTCYDNSMASGTMPAVINCKVQ